VDAHAHAHAQGQDEQKGISEVLTIGVAHNVPYNIPTKRKKEGGDGRQILHLTVGLAGSSQQTPQRWAVLTRPAAAQW